MESFHLCIEQGRYRPFLVKQTSATIIFNRNRLLKFFTEITILMVKLKVPIREITAYNTMTSDRPVYILIDQW